MRDKIQQQIILARRALCTIAELSGQEKRTQAYIKGFLQKHCSMQIMEQEGWLYAKHDEGSRHTVVIRADHDAVPAPGGAQHLCGHDGHTAALLGLALLMEGRQIGKNAILLFQHAEETGAGAPACCQLFALEGLGREDACIIGCHNIPGEALGTVLFRRGSFACASCGLDIHLAGSPTHAAYPEKGVNPSGAVAHLSLELPTIAAQVGQQHGCMALATIVGMRTGDRTFGVAASEGRLWVTLRAETSAAFSQLNARVDQAVCDAAAAEGLRYSIVREDSFPSTENDDALQKALEQLCIAQGLPYKYLDQPYRWSEDFGHYGKYLPACFFGIGAGLDTAPLHTERYVYPDDLAPITAAFLWQLLQVL